MENSLKSIATNYGLYLGVALALLTIITYAVDIGLFVNAVYGISLYIIMIVFGIIAIVNTKRFFNGYITFKGAFTSYFITILIGLLISALVSFILFNFIDVESSEILRDKAIEKVVQTLEGFNVPTETIDETVEKMESENLFSIGNVIQSIAINYLLPLTVIGLIVAAVMKKNPPEAE
ncbi:DUF4199 domain-containing protein [Algibacter sp. 2305UL17-15]|uniref:DUF4199 domain-containing protein n=1 Tax=Algibacter sp. 2305UL17-15 TaxID=3231268 RepID=UPI0034593901